MSKSWKYQGFIVEEFVENCEGFVYLITNKLTGKKYIGKKFVTSTRKLPPPAGKKRKITVVKESNWRNYYGSNDFLKEDVKQYGKENFEREILHICKTKAATNQLEIKEQFLRDVLYAVDKDGNREYYNENIAGRYYPVDELIYKKE